MKTTPMIRIAPIALVALALAAVACSPPETPQAQGSNVVEQPETPRTLVPFPPEPIKIGPGGGGNLTWTEAGTPLPTNESQQMRDDFFWRTDYLVARIGTDDVAVEKVQFTVNYNVGGSVMSTAVVIHGKNNHLSWSRNGNPFQLCSSKDAACVAAPIPVELTGTLAGGTFKVWRTLGGTEEAASEISFKPLLSGYCS